MPWHESSTTRNAQSQRSLLPNREVNAVVLGTEFGDRMRAAFTTDVAQSVQISLEQWQHRPINLRVKETFARGAVGSLGERTRQQ